MKKATPQTSSKIDQLSISLKEYDKQFTQEEKAQIEQEVQYLRVLIGLRKARIKSGLTQEQLSLKSKIPRATITRIEAGQRNATLKTLLTLGAAMGKSLELRWV